jgi:peroxiredoxin
MMTLTLLTLLSATPVALPTTEFPNAPGGTASLAKLVQAHPFTVVFFFSAECPVQRSHDARLLELVKAFDGVGFVGVDAQADADLARDAKEASRRGYPFPLLVDTEGALADLLGVRYSTTVVVLDAKGVVHYRGGLDSDRVKLSDSPTPFLKAALEALVAGQEPHVTESKALGCVLRRR